MAHIPTVDIRQLGDISFDRQLALAQQPNRDYDVDRWLFVPNTYTEYRYILGTRGEKPLICVGINPSTARPGALDPTLKSVERIARNSGFDSFIMFNVYAQRATSPDDMERTCNPELHRENMRAFAYILSRTPDPVVWAAWGTIIEKRDYLWPCLRDMIAWERLPAPGGSPAASALRQDIPIIPCTSGRTPCRSPSTWRDPSYQNVLWTLLAGALVCWAADWAQRTPDALHLLAATAAFAGAFWLLEVCHTDYGGWGMALILLFHLSRGNRLIQLAGLAVFCVASVGGVSIELYALVSLAFIWLYDGRRGYCSRPIQWLCYAFYPVHLLLLWLHARTVDGIWYLT